MSAQQEQRIVLCSALPLSNGLVIGWNGTTTPLNLQDLANSGVPQLRAYQTLGLELYWTGLPVGQIAAQGCITGAAAAMATLSAPTGGSVNPDLLPPDDTQENLPTPPTFGTQGPNPVTLPGYPYAALATWDLTKLRMNFFQLLVTLNPQTAGLLWATLSLMYTT